MALAKDLMRATDQMAFVQSEAEAFATAANAIAKQNPKLARGFR